MIVNQARIILDLDTRQGRPGARKFRQVFRAADWRQSRILIEGRLQGDRASNLASIDELLDRPKYASVHRVGEVLGFQEVGDHLEQPVVA